MIGSYALPMVLVPLLAAASASAGGFYGDLIECAKAMRVCSVGKLSVVSTPSRDFAFLVADRAGQQGFYSFAADEACFQVFPPAPPPAAKLPPPPPSIWNLYGVLTRFRHKEPPAVDPYIYYKFESGLSEPVYLSFKRQEDRSVELSLARGEPLPGKVTYLPAGALGCQRDVETQGLLRAEVLQRIASAHATWQGAPAPPAGDVIYETQLVGRPQQTFYRHEDCIKALETCSGSIELKAAAQAELAKFKH